MSRDPFMWWYSLSTVARRLDKSPLTIRRALMAGKFGGIPGTPECPCRHVCGEWLFPWPAIARFLNLPLPADTPPPADAPAWRVRSEAELRRQVAHAVQTSGGAAP